MARRVLVIGGGAAGMSAASAARRTDPALDVTVLEAGEHAAYGVCGLPYFVAGVVPTAQTLLAHPPEVFRDRRGIDLRLGVGAAALDVPARLVRTTDGEELGWDALVLGTGAAPVVPAVPGVDHPRVFAVRSLSGAVALRALLETGRVGRAVVVGAGYVGLEMAEAFAERGIATDVVDALDHVLTTVDAPVRALVEAEVRRHAGLHLGQGLSAVEPDGERLVVHLTDTCLPADVVVLAVGVRPSTALLAPAGPALGPAGALVVDESMRTSVPGVWAAGDCIAVQHRVLDRPAYVPLGPAANRTGRVAGTVAAGGRARFAGVVGTAIVKVFGLDVGLTGLSLDAARAAGLPALATDHQAGSRAKYYPGTRPLTVRLVHTPGGRLLGAQVAGAEGVLARIDVLATALFAGLSVDDVADLDLAYAPPFAPVYDPVLQAALAVSRRRVS